MYFTCMIRMLHDSFTFTFRQNKVKSRAIPHNGVSDFPMNTYAVS